MRSAICITLIFAGGSAWAHPGHLAEVAGHGHWLGAAAIGAAIAIGLWAAAKGRKTATAEAEAEDEVPADDAEAQEA